MSKIVDILEVVDDADCLHAFVSECVSSGLIPRDMVINTGVEDSGLTKNPTIDEFLSEMHEKIQFIS